MSRIACSDCAKFVYNLQTGEQEKYDAGEEMLPILRGDNPTPCDVCPRGGPENEDRYRLNWRNRMALDLYRRIKSTPGSRLPPHLRGCPITQRNFYLIAQIIATAKAEAKALAMQRAREESERERG